MAPWFLSELHYPRKLEGRRHEPGPVDNAASLPLIKMRAIQQQSIEIAVKPANDLNSLSFYQNSPLACADFDDIQTICYNRISLLKDIEIDYSSIPNNEERNKQILRKDKRYGFNSLFFTKKPELKEMDELSHLVVKLAYSSRQDELNWFITQETRLFKARLSRFGPNEINQILKLNLGFQYKVLTPADIENFGSYDREYIKEGAFKVPFSHGCLLMPSRFPIDGFIYVPQKQLILVVSELFRNILDQSIKTFSSIEIENMKLAHIIKHIDTPQSQLYESKNTDLDISNINAEAQSHFPPCMKRLFGTLRTQHHIKHFGRLQLGLFLKGLGFSMEDALRFWREEFCHTMTIDKFIKMYEYSIKHYYGKVGKMADYNPWGCYKITMFEGIGDSEHHGCPFRHAQRAELHRILGSYNLRQPEIQNISKRAYEHPQLACIDLFKATHDKAPLELMEYVGRHPNAFYDASKQYKKQNPGNTHA